MAGNTVPHMGCVPVYVVYVPFTGKGVQCPPGEPRLGPAGWHGMGWDGGMSLTGVGQRCGAVPMLLRAGGSAQSRSAPLAPAWTRRWAGKSPQGLPRVGMLSPSHWEPGLYRSGAHPRPAGSMQPVVTPSDKGVCGGQCPGNEGPCQCFMGPGIPRVCLRGSKLKHSAK